MQAAAGATVVVVAYPSKAGKEADLLHLTREHIPCCAARVWLQTDRWSQQSTGRHDCGRSSSGADGGVERAHSNPEVRKLWEGMPPPARSCSLEPVGRIVHACLHHLLLSIWAEMESTRRSLSLKSFVARSQDLMGRCFFAGRKVLAIVSGRSVRCGLVEIIPIFIATSVGVTFRERQQPYSRGATRKSFDAKSAWSETGE